MFLIHTKLKTPTPDCVDCADKDDACYKTFSSNPVIWLDKRRCYLIGCTIKENIQINALDTK